MDIKNWSSYLITQKLCAYKAEVIIWCAGNNTKHMFLL